MKIAMPRRASSTVAGASKPVDPLNMELRRKAWGFSSSGDNAAAAAVWRAILAVRGDDGDAAAELGAVLAAMGKHDDALQAFERALEFGADPRPAKKSAWARRF